MNTNEEIRCGYRVSAEMKRVWAIQLEMVKYLIDICKKNHLKIWAEGGTLLGAVREHGYIPWDDDIDMLMPREDYDKLVSISKNEFKDPFFFQCAYTDRQYYRGHAQLRYNGTSMILPGDIFQKFHQGIFIDIFVYDAIPENSDQEWEAKLRRADEISYKLYDASYSLILCKRPITVIRKKLSIAFGRGLKLFREYEDLFRPYSWQAHKRIACPCFNRHIFNTSTQEIEWYRSTIYLPFEDIQIPAPVDYHLVLTTQYGPDYMTPRMAPSMHGSDIVMDAAKSYKKCLRKMRINAVLKIIKRNLLKTN